jgi:CheY-like chemotaxis protein
MMDISVPPIRLLLIDDSVPFRQTLARLLRVAGHTVWEAETGAVGLALSGSIPWTSS